MGYSAPATSRHIPTRGDAHRAMEALRELDAGIVVLYGSVGSGTAREGSDIDLCLVFDDLGDYSTRMYEKDQIDETASVAVGCPVDVLMTDRPEWAARVGCVSSLERHIADYGIVLKERPAGNVDWDKAVEPPTTDDEYAQDALHHMRRALTDLTVGACVAGLDLGDEPLSDTDWLSGWYRMLDEQDLLVEVCFNAQMVIGTAVTAVNYCLPGPHLSRPTRDVLAALDTMPLSPNERNQIEATLVSVTSADVAMWRRAWESTRSEGRRSDCLAQTRDKATRYHAESMLFDARDMADTATEIIESRHGRTSFRAN